MTQCDCSQIDINRDALRALFKHFDNDPPEPDWHTLIDQMWRAQRYIAEHGGFDCELPMFFALEIAFDLIMRNPRVKDEREAILKRIDTIRADIAAFNY